MPNLGRERVGHPVPGFGPPQPEHGSPAGEQAKPSPPNELLQLRRDFPLWAFLRDPTGNWYAIHYRTITTCADPAAIRQQVEAMS